MSKSRLAAATIRLSPEKHHELSALAYARGVTLAEVIRERIEISDPVFDALDRLQLDVALLKKGQGRGLDSAGPKDCSASALPPSDSSAVLLEILLLLRGLSPPERLDRARAEMERQGIKFWQGKAT